VKAVCSAVRGWAQDIEARSGALNVATIKNAAQGKAAIQRFFKAAVNDTSTVVSKLRAAGNPSVSGGEKIAGSVVAAFTRIDAALTQGRKQADALPTGDPAAFRDAGAALANTVQKSVANAGAGLSGLASPELSSAAKKQPECAPLAA
jgi:hypothetical protein